VVRIDAAEGIEVLEEVLGMKAEPGPYNTVAGFLLEKAGHIPKVGEQIDVDGFRLTVVEMDGLRIAAVEASPSQLAARESAS
jgi:putative hemolysin